MIASLKKANEQIEQQQLQIEELTKKLRSSNLSMKMLQHQVEQLVRRVYGPRSEKLDPNQMMFDNLLLETLQQPEGAQDTVTEQQPVSVPARKRSRAKKRNHPGRIPIPEHLERVEIELDIPEQDKVCPETGKPLSPVI